MPFSVLMSLYAKEHTDYLRQSLESVFNQTLPPDEVILVEDGPLTSELYSVVNEFAQKHNELKIINIEKNGGLGRALNEGLKHCSHELVARMDTDDISLPDRFEKEVSFMNSHPEIDVCSAWIAEFDEDNPDDIISIKKLPETHDELYKYGKFRCPINHPVSIFRKKAVIDSGSYQHIRLFEDYYLWGRMMVKGYKFHNIQETLLKFRLSPQMYSRRGGLKYALTEINLINKFRKIGYVDFLSSVFAIISRFIVRIIPNSTRKLIYTKLLR